MAQRQTLTAIYDKFNFGKHNGKTVRFVLENDPQYILWLHEKGIVSFSKEIIEQADENYDPLGGSWGWDGFEGE